MLVFETLKHKYLEIFWHNTDFDVLEYVNIRVEFLCSSVHDLFSIKSMTNISVALNFVIRLNPNILGVFE